MRFLFQHNPAWRKQRFRLFSLSLLGLFVAMPTLAAEEQTPKTPAATAEEQTLDPVVVTAAPMSDPLTVVTDAKAPRQPVPAHDGADYLKTVPGFTVIRKGGSDGDPVFRGMAGSRLNILADGEMIHGGCGGRMDPPTAYIFPESFDRITVLKGPQSVIWGPVSAGTVLFERDFKPYTAPDYRLFGGLMLGSYGRNDQVLDAQAGNATFYARMIGTRSSMDDYKDGDGKRVHSQYMRWSGGATFGFTPNETTRLELSANVSDGEAAYADRMMDGAKFARENYSLRFEKKNISAFVEKLDALVYYNTIDHVMDNYSLRQPGSTKNVSNPDRQTTGLRVSGDLVPGDTSLLKVGVDQQSNRHRFRSGNNLTYRSAKRVEDANFDNYGLFAEWTQSLTEKDRLIAGLRTDFWRAEDKRSGFSTSGKTRHETLPSGFIRYERDYGEGSTVFVGLGHSERFPDYWEVISQNKQSETSDSAFNTKPEKNTQLDLGTVYRITPELQVAVSAFYSRMRDYILIDNTRTLKPAILVRNIKATTYGGEVGLSYALTPQLRSGVSLAYVRGSNGTDHTPLAQMPPFDSRFTLDYDNGTWSFGALWRLVAAQNRFDKGRGNIAGQDIGEPTAGFGVFSVNGGYRFRKELYMTAGIDNLFNKTYAEAISRSGSMVPGYIQTMRINEPGRFFWLKLNLNFD
ncbi:MAG: TonB-dependent copper receptor [Proteobacteria bacterium]|nr:TonB-dependent copper receptor [Pseudomonadota bacterium]MCL2307128.1 TonB-dependent copper receptor [Pseudomonadota bacterium]